MHRADKVLMRLPASWAGIQAAQQLEADGIATHLILVYRQVRAAPQALPHQCKKLSPPLLVCSFAQAVAAAQAGVSVIQPNIGRLADWYKQNPGAIRDPRVRPHAALPASLCYSALAA